jgi:hypothetical protein
VQEGMSALPPKADIESLHCQTGRAVDIEPVSVLISKIREYFNSRAEIFSLLLLGKFEFVTQRQLPNSKSAALAGFWAATV